MDGIMHVGPDHPNHLLTVLPVMVSFLLGLVAFVFWDRIRRLFGLEETVGE